MSNDEVDKYNTDGGRKLCVIFRDNTNVLAQPVRNAFGPDGALKFDLLERNVGSGEADTEVLKFFEDLATDRKYDGYCCLAVVMIGCYSARHGWGINVSGRNIDFDQLVGPFARSRQWQCRPKLWFVQYQSESEDSCSTVSCDALPMTPGPELACAFADTAIAVGYGGIGYTEILCQLLQQDGGKLEYHQLMTLLNGRVQQQQQQQSENEDAPLACIFASQLTKELFLGAL